MQRECSCRRVRAGGEHGERRSRDSRTKSLTEQQLSHNLRAVKELVDLPFFVFDSRRLPTGCRVSLRSRRAQGRARLGTLDERVNPLDFPSSQTKTSARTLSPVSA
jgi:hypothetical protein